MVQPDVAHNRHEALTLTSYSLDQYVSRSEHIVREYQSAVRVTLELAEQELRSRVTTLDRARAALAAADEYNEARCRRDVNRAKDRLAVAESVVETIRSELDELRSRVLTFLDKTDELVSWGQEKLRSHGADLIRYVAGSTGGLSAGGGIAAGSKNGSISGSAHTITPYESILRQHGLEEFPISRTTPSDLPILDWETRESGNPGDGKPRREDIAWTLGEWTHVVSKIVARGGTLEELSARDLREDNDKGMRRLGGVWETVFGDDKIIVEERLDGTFEVKSGRHRMEVAVELGIDSLPMIVKRLDRS